MTQAFLFTDLVGFTALAAERGDEHAADVAQGFQRAARALLREHGAREVKSLGDGLMLRCPDPAEAVRLGARLAGELEGLPPVRVGVHHGPAVERDGDWFGTTVNVASRLCTAAGGGEALVSETALQAAGRFDGVTLGERRLHWLRNVTEPVAARVAWAEPEPASPPPLPARTRVAAAWRRFAEATFCPDQAALREAGA